MGDKIRAIQEQAPLHATAKSRLTDILRAVLATAAGAFVVTGMSAILVRIWPIIEAGHWYSFPLLCLWFYGTIHAARKTVLATLP